MVKIQLEYCVPWNHTARAVSLADELLSEFAAEIESFKLVPSDGGRFEFTVDGDLLYSKKATKRHAEPGEIKKLFEAYIETSS